MQKKTFIEQMEAQWTLGKFLCIGLDTDYAHIPRLYHRRESTGASHITNTITTFNQVLINATWDVACAYKYNLAPYLAYGVDGLAALKQSIIDCRGLATTTPIILDCKSGDVYHSNTYWAQCAFDYLKVDALTVHPYVGTASLEPFFERKEKGIFVLCRTSDPGSGEIQDIVSNEPSSMLYQYIARRIAEYHTHTGNVGLVVGALDTHILSNVRRIAPQVPILIPGIGTQGGDVRDAYNAGKDERGMGVLLSASRTISTSENPHETAFNLARPLLHMEPVRSI